MTSGFVKLPWHVRLRADVSTPARLVYAVLLDVVRRGGSWPCSWAIEALHRADVVR